MEKLSDESISCFFREEVGRVRLFMSIREIIASVGEASEHIGKSQISFGTKRRFAWVWMPLRTGKDRPEGCIILTLALRRKAESARVVEAVEPYQGRWTHHIVISDSKDLDSEILALIEEAYIASN
ncbi:DUF5655 domain-containing protein [Youngiibacter multivorans]|uniref:DUF5655 domain-containing protein n=1 Tax=Youngiibacter multivorans TaxID=937251 RepID=A0ABS4G8Z3_9CLOT|nr:DUF5655 domain-containing protein [Youngiibacter multivorans]MBP1920996.1 hypothetical protein [Youngiibacter multivorans]